MRETQRLKTWGCMSSAAGSCVLLPGMILQQWERLHGCWQAKIFCQQLHCFSLQSSSPRRFSIYIISLEMRVQIALWSGQNYYTQHVLNHVSGDVSSVSSFHFLLMKRNKVFLFLVMDCCHNPLLHACRQEYLPAELELSLYRSAAACHKAAWRRVCSCYLLKQSVDGGKGKCWGEGKAGQRSGASLAWRC